ncbi:MAG: DUF2851 family protein [Bacteroidetes bacterium]|nr:DUF2851 family protein [Bacteroidota bacterium]
MPFSLFRKIFRWLKNKILSTYCLNLWDLGILSKHADNLFQIESLLLGQAGFLDGNLKEEYPNKIKEEYLFLKHKYNLTPIPLFLWDFKSIRPHSFPNIRLVQLAQIIRLHFPFFEKSISSLNSSPIFININASNYWENHYLFKPSSQSISKKTGVNFANMININVVFPFLYTYGKHMENLKFRKMRFNI